MLESDHHERLDLVFRHHLRGSRSSGSPPESSSTSRIRPPSRMTLKAEVFLIGDRGPLTRKQAGWGQSAIGNKKTFVLNRSAGARFYGH